MTVRASDIITQARDVHPAFDLRSTPNAVALRHVARYQQALLSAIAETALHRLHVRQSVTLPLADFAAGIVLDAHLRVHGATVQYTDPNREDDDLLLVEYPRRLERWNPFPMGYVQAGRLLLVGDEDDDWDDVASIDIDLFPAGPDTLVMPDELLLPGSPQRACVADLAAFMAVRAGVDVPDPTPMRESYLDEVTERRRAKVGQIADLW